MACVYSESNIIPENILLNIEHNTFLENVEHRKIFYTEKRYVHKDAQTSLGKIDRGKLPHGSVILLALIKK